MRKNPKIRLEKFIRSVLFDRYLLRPFTNSLLRYDHGMSLTEVILATGLAGFLAASSAAILVNAFKNSKIEKERLDQTAIGNYLLHSTDCDTTMADAGYRNACKNKTGVNLRDKDNKIILDANGKQLGNFLVSNSCNGGEITLTSDINGEKKKLLGGVPITCSYNANNPKFIATHKISCNGFPYVYIIDAVTGDASGFLAYPLCPTCVGSNRAAIGNVDDDPTTLEIVTTPGRGIAPYGQVRVFSMDGVEKPSFRYQPFGAYSRGLYIALGDMNGDGKDDVITSQEQDQGRVNVAFVNPAGTGFVDQPSKSFAPFSYSSYAGGSRVAYGGPDEIVVAGGVGIAPVVKFFSVAGTPHEIRSFAPPINPPPVGHSMPGVEIRTHFLNGGTEPEIMVLEGSGMNGLVHFYQYDQSSPYSLFTNFQSHPDRRRGVSAVALALHGPAVDTVFMSVNLPSSTCHLGITGISKVDATTKQVDSSFSVKPLMDGTVICGPLDLVGPIKK